MNAPCHQRNAFSLYAPGLHQQLHLWANVYSAIQLELYWKASTTTLEVQWSCQTDKIDREEGDQGYPHLNKFQASEKEKELWDI